MEAKQVIRYALLLAYCLAVIAPLYIFFSLRGGLSGVSLSSLKSFSSTVYPLDGLLAFTFVAMQAIIGSNMLRLRLIFKKIMNFHRYQGVLALFFIILHPLAVLITYGFTRFIDRDIVAPSLKIYILLAWLAWLIVITTISTAIMAWQLQLLAGYWRKIHVLNYAVFPLVWIHSWFVGTDVQSTPLKYLWIVYALIWLPSMVQRFRTGSTA